MKRELKLQQIREKKEIKLAEEEKKLRKEAFLKAMNLKRMVQHFIITGKKKTECIKKLEEFKTCFQKHGFDKFQTEDGGTFEKSYLFLFEQIQKLEK